MKKWVIVSVILLTMACAQTPAPGTDATLVARALATIQASETDSTTAPDKSINPLGTNLSEETTQKSNETASLSQLLPQIAEAGCINPNSSAVEAPVTHIVDGDTIGVSIGGQEFSVRYIGIDAPETVKPEIPVQPFGPEASAKNKEMVEGKTVLLVKDVSDTDQYGRLLRYVFAGDLFVNYELVRTGFARVVIVPPDVACTNTFLEAQAQAVDHSVGLWAIPTPAPAVELQPIIPTTIPNNAPQTGCDPSYPGVCIPPAPPDLDCKDIPYRRFQVIPPDPHNFDGNQDGLGCET